MLQEQISRKISALVDWAVYYISRSCPKHEQDHQTIALFKSVLMTIDPAHFRVLIDKHTSIKELQLEICDYFSIKLQQSKQNVLQGGNQQYTPMKILVMFKIIIKQQCMRAISLLDDHTQDTVTKILEQIITQRNLKKELRPQNQNKRLKQQNKRLRLTIESLQINQSQLLHKNLQLQRKLRQYQYLNLQKQAQLQECKSKLKELQEVIQEVSLQIFNSQRQQNNKPTSSFNLTTVLPQTEKISHHSYNQLILPHNLSSQKSEHNTEYIQYLQSQVQQSQNIIKRFLKLRQIHEDFKQQMEKYIIT